MDKADKDFYTVSHEGCFAFVTLLVAVLLSTTIYLSLQTIAPVRSVTGTVEEIIETPTGNRINHSLTVRTDQNEVIIVHLRHNGRILKQLQSAEIAALSLESLHHTRAHLLYQGGVVVSLTPLDVREPAVKEATISLPGSLAIIITTLFLLTCFIRPGLFELRRRVSAA